MGFVKVPLGMRPQADRLDGSGLYYEACEYGGDFPDCMPQAVIVTDINGGRATYVPLRDHDGDVANFE